MPAVLILCDRADCRGDQFAGQRSNVRCELGHALVLAGIVENRVDLFLIHNSYSHCQRGRSDHESGSESQRLK